MQHNLNEKIDVITLPSDSSAVLTFPWMFSRNLDCVFFFFPLLFGSICFALSQMSPVATNAIWLFLVLDAFGAGPLHFGPTWFAYFDKKNRAHWKEHRVRQLIFFLAPPLLIVGTTLGFMYPVTMPFVTLVLTVWAVQHLVQQNVGILLLYHNQNKGEAIVNRPLEMKSQQYPAIAFSIVFFHRIFLSSPQNIAWTVFFVGLAAWAALPVVKYLLETQKQLREGATLNVPAFCFWMISILSLLPFAFLGKNFAEAWIIPVTVHWFQYIGLNYALVKSKYAKTGELIHDLPKWMSPLVLFSITCAFCFGIAIAIFGVASTIYGANGYITKVLTGVWLGITACHYFLDAFLWRFREPFNRQSILPHLLSYRKAAASR